MELNENDSTLNYSIRLFQDDFVQLIGTLVHEELHKGRAEEEAYADTTLIPTYFSKAFKLNCDNVLLKANLLKQDYQEEEVWLYYSVKIDSIPESILIENKIFSDLFSDQVNMLIFSYRNKEKGLTFDTKNTKQRIALNNI